MHPRNPYRTPPDFAALAESFPPLQPYILKTSSGSSTIDYKNEIAQRLLTQGLLHRDFQVELTLPDNRLCPPVPNRLNYVLWIQDIINFVSPEDQPVVRGIDIGTGASAIYPLLACRLSQNWILVGTDIDELSIEYARSNVDRSGLQDRIAITKASPGGPILLPLHEQALTPYDFTMCNPPFYASGEDVLRSAEAKEFMPNSVCTGAEVEMITTGGESQFVCTMVRESVNSKERCRWYTSMLGKMSSMNDVVALLRAESIDNYAITEFVQGQTRRWAIAWSFLDIRLPDNLARISNPALQALMPARATLRQPLSHTPPVSALLTVSSSLRGVTVSDTRTPSGTPAYLASVVGGDTWSRAARRHKATAVVDADGTPMLVCRFLVVQDDEGLAMEFVWIRGRDRHLFESFVNHVGRKMREVK